LGRSARGVGGKGIEDQGGSFDAYRDRPRPAGPWHLRPGRGVDAQGGGACGGGRPEGAGEPVWWAEFEEQYEAVKNEIIKEVKFAYFDLFWADQSIQINEEEKAILEKLEKVAQRKYESNRVSQQDVIKVQVELSKIIQKLLLLRQNRESLAVKLNSLLNRPQDSNIEKILHIDRRNFDYALEDILNMSQGSRQELRAADNDILTKRIGYKQK